MISNVIIYILFPLSILSVILLSWYVKKLLMVIEEISLEIRERFKAFHNFLDETYKMDLFYGEPRLKDLLELVKDFDIWASELENRIMMEKENDNQSNED